MVNGLSCFGCHRQGLQGDFRDEVRAAGVLAGDGLQQLQRLYLPDDHMQSFVQRDQQVYRAAIERILIAYRADSSQVAHAATPSDLGRPVDEPVDEPVAEPIEWVAAEYLRDLDAQAVAAELGLADLDALRQQIQERPALRQLGLGTLIQARAGTLKRSRWEAIDGTSLFQDVAVELRLGTPILPGTTRTLARVNP
jgi:hypothetical protein